MVDNELIGNWRNMLKHSISSWLLKTDYEGMGEQDKEEFERDFDEILDLALIGLKYKTQLSQEGTTSDIISRQAAIDALIKADYEFTGILSEPRARMFEQTINALPSAQPDKRWNRLMMYLADLQLTYSPGWGANGCGDQKLYDFVTELIERLEGWEE